MPVNGLFKKKSQKSPLKNTKENWQIKNWLLTFDEKEFVIAF